MSWTGRLVRIDLGTGGWVLETRDGKKIALFGDVDAALDGSQVEVQGTKLEGSSFMMTGDTMVQVDRIRRA
jgi:hypothetical protein